MTETENKIAGLHSWYCKRTKLFTKLQFAHALWFDRLRDYEYKADLLWRDCELVVRYLLREISRDKRNLGALKLINFLQPDNFDADLALAKLSLNRAKSPPATKMVEQRVGDVSRRVEVANQSAELAPMSEGVKKFMTEFAERKQRKAATQPLNPQPSTS